MESLSPPMIRRKANARAVKTRRRAESVTMSLEGKDHLLSDDGEAAPEPFYREESIACSGKWQPEWFAAYTMSRHEKRIASHCERIGIEPFIPLCTSQRSWKNRTTVVLEMPVFPNYLFVRLLPQDHGPLMRLPGLLSIVGSALGPVVIPDGDMELLRRVIVCKSIAPHPLLTTGDRVRVKTGPLAGLVGFVLKQANGLRFIVTLDVIGKSVSLHIEGSALELVASHDSPSVDHQNAVA
jgi:transcription termination/antitermination protein NusG